MAKPLLLAAVVANFFLFVTSSRATSYSESFASSSSYGSSSSSSSSSSTHSESVAVASSGNQQHDSEAPCEPPPTPKPCETTEPPKCHLNHEEWSNCPIVICRPQTCEDIGHSVACLDLLPGGKCPVAPGCVCADGYVRNEKGICIPWSDCPSCGGDSNAQSGCGYNCNRLCSNYDKKPGACPASCLYNGCDCKKGYVFDEILGKCVYPSHCTPNCTQCNEEYHDCVQAQCGPKTCSQLGFNVPCPKIDHKYCLKGCLCKSGYVRDKTGECIPKDKCPSCGGDKNAKAGCGVNCNRHCYDIKKPTGFCAEICYENACDCKDGFYHDDNINKCVLAEACSPTCSPNEFYSTCMQADCAPQNCTQLGFPVPCPRIDPKYCKKGCLCKEGYARNCDGVCIPSQLCPSCGGDPNAVAGCGNNCGRLCSNYKDNNTVCTLECAINGCDCRKGYVYDTAVGRCVLPKDCSPPCRSDEVYSDCVNAPCPTRNCSYLDVWVDCLSLDSKDCIPGCVCKDNLMREDDGSCVPCHKCKTSVCPKDEVYSDCINGGCTAKNCSQIGTPIPCIKLDPKACIKGCLCKKGYLRDDCGKCVPVKDCKHNCNKPNEYYEPCGYTCPPQTCDSINKTYSCPLQTSDNCEPLCKCKKGFYRNKNGECITEEQCLRCTGPHEFYSCGGACDNVCETLDKQSQTNCPIINIKCNEKCYCEKDYARAKNGTCIPICNCKDPQCPINERYEECPAWLTEPQKCSELGYPVEDPKIPCDGKCPVKPACVCVDGYARDCKGVCIPKKDCPSCGGDPNAQPGCGVNCNKRCEDIEQEDGACILLCKLNGCDCKDGFYYSSEKKKCVLPTECDVCNKPNEYLEVCDYGCPPNTCESLDKVYVCPIREGDKCRPRCKCKPGFLRNKKGECITEEQCRKCMGPHEYFSCGVACDNVCETLAKQNQTNCPIINIQCNEKCYCESNYARAKNGTCIPIENCKDPQCRVNETYVQCPAWVPGPQKCAQLGFPVPQPDTSCKCPVKPGCVCSDGYVKNSKDVCILKKDCPSCGGDKNAVSGCGVNCNKHCEDLGKEPGPCILLCMENKCDCRDGYYFEKDKKKCVLASECPGVCPGVNEVYEDCFNPKCRVNKCSEVGFPLKCCDPPECKKGCTCKDGYVRNAKGVCVTPKECKTCGGDKNAEAGCGVNCLKRCSDVLNPDHPKICPRICKVNACDCKKGFYWDENKKKCVLAEECTQPCYDPEVYDSCVNGGCGHRNCSQLCGPILCIDPIKCIGGCSCKEGYLRLDATNECVPKDKCPRVSTVDSTLALANFERGNVKLAIEFMKSLLGERPGENFMYSTLSLLTALAQVTLPAVDETLQQLLSILNLSCKDEIRTIFPILMDKLNNQQNVVLSVANKIYANENYPFSKQFTDDAKLFDSEVENVDFSQNEEAANDINDWVKEKTNGLIEDLVDKDMFSALTRAAIFNCIYFLGNWKHQFNPDNTQPRDFYISDDETVSIPTMFQENRFKYLDSDDLNGQCILLTYKGGENSLLICIPKEKEGLNTLLDKLDPDAIQNILDSMEFEKLRVFIPKYDFETDISNLKDLLIKLGLTKLFEETDDFEGIFDNGETLIVSDIVQKTAMKVDETGTEAAAATGVIVGTTSVQITKDFLWNRPGAFFLLSNGTLLFSGVYAGDQ